MGSAESCLFACHSKKDERQEGSSAVQHYAPAPARDAERLLRGVSARHLHAELLAEVAAAGFGTSATVHEVEPIVIRSKGSAVLCPRDGRMGCAYVDAVTGEDNAGPSNFMLSYTWAYKVRDIVNSLTDYCERQYLDPARTYIWICCLCVNQHRVQEARQRNEVISFEQFSEEFGRRVAGIGHVLALMEPWDNPRYLTRVWCIFELFVCSELGCKVDVLMPRAEAKSFTEALQGSAGGIHRLHKTMSNIRVEHAEASVASDKEHILKLIEEDNGGFSFLNRRVHQIMEAWFANAADSEVKEHVQIPRVAERIVQRMPESIRGRIKLVGAATLLTMRGIGNRENLLAKYSGH